MLQKRAYAPIWTTETIVPDKPWPQTICTCTAVRRADRALSRIYDDALRPSGLAVTQYSLLSIISRAPQPLTLGELARAQVMDRTTLSRALAPLVRDALVKMTPGDDKRTKVIRLTTTGQTRLDATRPLWRTAQNRILAEMGAEWVDRLLDDLETLVATVRAPQDTSA